MKKYISFLNVVASFGVVLMHTNTMFWDFSTQPDWFIANLTGHSLNFAVPVFFMISGMTLLDYEDKYTTKVFFQKRIKKAVVPFIIWSLLGVIYHLVVRNSHVNLMRLPYDIVNTKYVEYYWFFIPLFIVYLSIPIMTKLRDRKILEYTIGLMLILNIIIPFIFYVIDKPVVNNSTFSISGYILYVLLGYYISQYDMTRYKHIIYLMGIINWLLLVFGTYMLSIQQHKLINTFMGYLNLPNVFISIAVVVFIKNVEQSDQFTQLFNWCQRFSKYTFGVYLLHWFVIAIIKDFKLMSTYSVEFMTIGAIIVYVVSFVISYIISKISPLKYIIPQ